MTTIPQTDKLTADMLHVAAGARLLGCHEETLRRLAREGKIKAYYFGRALAIPRSEIERYQRERMR
jgi:excisionase family DNA binding protein